MPYLPAVDSERDVWGPDHDKLELTPIEVSAGNLLGLVTDIGDDTDRGQRAR